MRKLIVLFVAVAFVVAYTIPAIAADWKFYGSARMSTFMDSDSKELTGTGFDDDDLTWDLQGNSRIGAKVKAGAIGGRFEYGAKDPINLRLLYGKWKFGAGTLVVGQDYTPMHYKPGGMVWGGDAGFSGYGRFYDGRNPQIKLKKGGFQIALIKPKVKAVGNDPGTETDTTLPKIEASYGFKGGPIALYFVGGYNTYDTVAQTATTEKEYSVDSYIYGLGFKFATGPFSVKGNIYTGTNPKNFGQKDKTKAANKAAYNAATDSIEDADTLGYAVAVGFKASDMLKFEAGYGHIDNEIDVSGTKTEAEVTTYYVHAKINLAKGCFVVPEIGKIDYGDKKVGSTTTKMGDTTFYGAKWQINF